MLLIAIYLASILGANLLITHLGPAATPYVSLGFVGLTISARDRLHAAWGNRVAVRMGALIAGAGVLSYALQRDAGRVALASVGAFAVSEAVAAVVFSALKRRTFLQRSLIANLFGALLDTVVFFLIAFPDALAHYGPFQFACKYLGSVVYALLFARSIRDLNQ